MNNLLSKNTVNKIFLTVVTFLFFLALFEILRVIFVLYNYNEVKNETFIEIFKAFIYGLKLDISTASYIMLILTPFILLFSIVPCKLIKFLIYFIVVILVFISVSISISELSIYKEWRVKLNYKAISYLARPMEVIQTASILQLVIGVMSIAFITYICSIAYKKIVLTNIVNKRSFIYVIIHFLFLPLIFLGIRGKLSPIPIHQSDVYYSHNNFLNIAAVNSQWNLVASIYKNRFFGNENPFRIYDSLEVKKIIDSLYRNNDTTFYILKTLRPNIIFIILESWSADVIKKLGGYDSITPNFNKLCDEGILFTNCYATGTLSDQGIPAILSGQPSLPKVIICNQPDKFEKLPAISLDLKKYGYNTAFYFGGDLSYGNIKGYIYSKKFDIVEEYKDLKHLYPSGRLGIHDEYMFEYFYQQLTKLTQPYMACLFTLSSHSPYDYKFPEKFKWGGDARDYINGIYYADSCLGVFFNKVKNTNVYRNSIFILIADHSHHSPKNWHPFQKEYRKIPVLILGGAIKEEFIGFTYDYICNQTDIVVTILNQLKIKHSNYKWSRNLFVENPGSFSFYAFDIGFGWLNNDNYFVYSENDNAIVFYYFKSAEDSIKNIKLGYSYIQALFEEYLSL